MRRRIDVHKTPLEWITNSKVNLSFIRFQFPDVGVVPPRDEDPHDITVLSYFSAVNAYKFENTVLIFSFPDVGKRRCYLIIFMKLL